MVEADKDFVKPTKVKVEVVEVKPAEPTKEELLAKAEEAKAKAEAAKAARAALIAKVAAQKGVKVSAKAEV